MYFSGVSLVRGEPATYISHGKYRPIGETRFVQLPDKEQWNPPQSRNVQVVPASQLEQPQTPQNVTPSLSKNQKRKQKAYSQGYIDGRNGIQSRYQNVGSFSSRQRQPKQRLAPYTQDERRKKSSSYNPAPQVHRIPSIHSESRPENRSYNPDTQVHRMYPVDSRPLPDSDTDYDGDDYTKNMRFADSRSTRSSTQSVESLSEHTNPDVNRPSFRALTPKINQHQYETKDGNPNSYGHLQSQGNYSNQNRSINQVNRQAPSFAKSVRSNVSRSAVMIPQSSAQDIETESLNNQTTPPRYKPQIQRSKQQRSQPNINQRSQPHSPPPFDQRYQPPTVDDNDSDFDGDNQDDHTIFSSGNFIFYQYLKTIAFKLMGHMRNQYDACQYTY